MVQLCSFDGVGMVHHHHQLMHSYISELSMTACFCVSLCLIDVSCFDRICDFVPPMMMKCLWSALLAQLACAAFPEQPMAAQTAGQAESTMPVNRFGVILCCISISSL